MATKRATDRPGDHKQAKPAGHEVDDLVAENRKLRRQLAELDGTVALLYEFVRLGRMRGTRGDEEADATEH